MKKILISILFLVTASLVQAENINNFRNIVPGKSYVSEGVHLTSATTVATTTTTAVIYTGAASIHSVHITKPGINSTLELFDSFRGTPTLTAYMRPLFTTIQTSTAVTYDFQRSYYFYAYCSSGISINNRGTTPAEVTIVYTSK